MRNDTIITDYTCHRCFSTEHKRIPQAWSDKDMNQTPIEYHFGWYFCNHCGIHSFMRDNSLEAA